MRENCVPMQKGAEFGRSWSDIRGELAVYVLAAVVIGLAVLAWDMSQAIRELTAETKRLNQRMNADSRLIQLALLTADPERQPTQP